MWGHLKRILPITLLGQDEWNYIWHQETDLDYLEQVFSRVGARCDHLPLSWVQDPDNQFLNVSLLPQESYHFYAALGLYFIMIFYTTSDFLLVVISPCPEMMSVYLWNTTKLVVWATQHACGLEKERVWPLFRLLMKPGDLWKFPQFWEFWCHLYPLPELQLHDIGCVRRKGNKHERPSSTESVGSGAEVEWEGTWFFPATSIQKCPVMQAEAGRRAHCMSGAPMKISCCVTGVACHELGF